VIPMSTNLYEAIGGVITVSRLVDAFYPRVYADSDLNPLFVGDIEEIKHKQRLFLTQFLGGPQLYSEAYGLPNMKKLHMDFEITPIRAMAWLRCMNEAMDEIGLGGNERQFFYARLSNVAQVMINA
jgi:hemoglobin